MLKPLNWLFDVHTNCCKCCFLLLRCQRACAWVWIQCNGNARSEDDAQGWSPFRDSYKGIRYDISAATSPKSSPRQQTSNDFVVMRFCKLSKVLNQELRCFHLQNRPQSICLGILLGPQRSKEVSSPRRHLPELPPEDAHCDPMRRPHITKVVQTKNCRGKDKFHKIKSMTYISNSIKQAPLLKQNKWTITTVASTHIESEIPSAHNAFTWITNAYIVSILSVIHWHT